jgi:hypothetical protein
MNRIQILSLSALLALGLPALAQTAQAPQVTPTPAPPRPPEPDPDPAVLKAMKGKVFVIKYQDAGKIGTIIRPLCSGINGSRTSMTSGSGLDAITVRDFPENLAAIEEAIKRLDIPGVQIQDTDVELRVQVLFASKQPSSEGSLPEELQGVIKSLKGSLAYRSYTLAASFLQRSDTQGHALDGGGRLDGATLGLGSAKEPSQLRLTWNVPTGLELTKPQTGNSSIQIRKFRFYLYGEIVAGKVEPLASMETGVNLKEGEHVVVGTTMVKDHGLIVVLSARRVN